MLRIPGKTILVVLLLAMMLPSVGWAQVSFGQSTLFNDDWRFQLSDDSLYRAVGYDDAQWRRLDLPHDWSVEGDLSPQLASCTGYYPAGVAWYRKHFTVQKLDKDPLSGQLYNTAEQHYIYFEGIYNRSEVYLNGHLLGKRPSGFASFYYCLNDYLVEGDNVLAVRVDHSRYADSRWYTGSGIYRDVYYVKAHHNHLTPWGTSYVCTSLTDDEATIVVKSSYQGRVEKQVSIRVQLRDAKGKVVARGEIAPCLPVKPGQVVLKVRQPQRWDLDHPYLYTLHVQLITNLSKVDETDIPVGLRTLQFDANKGFALNGRWMKVKGVCLHHDAGVLGAVVPRDVWRRRLLNLKSIGANAIRCAHNPQAPVLYDLCDQLGLLVMDEASDEWEFPKRKWVEGWNVGTPAYDGTYDFFEEWIERDVTDMVRRDRHHPSVFLWSIGNEVDYPNDPYSHPVLDGKDEAFSQPIFGGYDPSRPNAERIGKIARRLAACVRKVDTSRPVTGALAGVVMSNETEYPEAVDVVGYNYTEKRYAADHAAYPHRIIYGSENGVGYKEWLAVRDNDYIFGQFVWTGTDYLGESGRWPSRGLHTGLLDFGSFPKPRGYFRASLWREDPVCYIGTYPIQRGRGNNAPSAEAPSSWNYPEGTQVRVVCYTNAPQARLLLNGRVIGETQPRDDSNGIICWDVAYMPGVLTAESLSAAGNVVSAYSIHTAGRAESLCASVDVQTLKAGGRVAHITLEVVDAEGHRVPYARDEITCTVEGAGRLLGLENSDNRDMGNHHDNRAQAYEGRLLAYIASGKRRGSIHVRFTAPGLHPTEVILKVTQ